MTTIERTIPTSRSVAPLGVATAVLAGALSVLFAHGWGEVLVVVPVMLVAAALVFGLAVPRALGREDSGGAALGLAVPAAVLLLPAFWSGLPLVLGVAGMIVGNAGRNARSGSGKSAAALVIATLAVVGYAAIHVAEVIAGNTGFLLD